MNSSLKIVTIAAIVSLSTACATITAPKSQTVNVTTTNSKAITVEVEGQSYQAPGVVEVTRDGKEKLVSTLDKDCASTTSLTKSIEPIFFGNILIGGLLGSSTDAGTGRMWKYQESINVQCKN